MGYLVRVRKDLGETFIGWYAGQRRRRGEVFEIEKKSDFSGKRVLDDGTTNGVQFSGWMEWVDVPRRTPDVVAVQEPVEVVEELAVDSEVKANDPES